jgi:competence protein ComEC
VVDTGDSADAAVGCLDAAGVRKVPVVVLTHFHADHVGGLAGILRARDVSQVLATPLADPLDQARLADAAAREAGLAVLPLTAGDARRVGQVSWRALWPRRIIRAGSVPNNASVVLLADVAGLRILLTGDIEPEAQMALAAEVARVQPGIDVVKVPHHGSVHQSPEFARAVGAPVALISVGADNDYGHPAEQTIRLYAGGGALVLRTDEHGDIAIVDTGSRAEVVVRHGMLPSS